MTNLTISIDGQILKKARMRALEEGISINALLREYLEKYTVQIHNINKPLKKY
jgi:predicted HicB family RNase H-like nuclease